MAHEKIEQAMEIVSQINDMISFAESQKLFLVAAKLEEARITLLSEFVDAADRPS